jgi:hypothetical protein
VVVAVDREILRGFGTQLGNWDEDRNTGGRPLSLDTGQEGRSFSCDRRGLDPSHFGTPLTGRRWSNGRSSRRMVYFQPPERVALNVQKGSVVSFP